MTAAELLERVYALGGRLEVRGDRLHVEAPAPLPEPLIEELRRHKPELMALLAQASMPFDVCPDCTHPVDDHQVMTYGWSAPCSTCVRLGGPCRR